MEEREEHTWRKEKNTHCGGEIRIVKSPVEFLSVIAEANNAGQTSLQLFQPSSCTNSVLLDLYSYPNPILFTSQAILTQLPGKFHNVRIGQIFKKKDSAHHRF